MDKTPTGIGSSAWWTDPTWPEGGTTVDRRRWVWAKLWTLDMGKLRSLCVTTFPPGTIFEPPAKVEPETIKQEQWVTILRGMAATDDEVRQIMQRMGFGWLYYLG